MSAVVRDHTEKRIERDVSQCKMRIERDVLQIERDASQDEE